jgi:hypothetical protein
MSRTLTAKARRMLAEATVRKAAIVEIAGAADVLAGAEVAGGDAGAADVTVVAVAVEAVPAVAAEAGTRTFRHGFSRIHTD